MQPAEPRTSRNQGFTLLEISIVLVVIGLILGGVLIGRDMMRRAEIQSIATDVERYTTAVMTFKTKYNYLPGDMPRASQIWGSYGGVCTTGWAYGTAPVAGVCNGNGNGIIQPRIGTTSSYREPGFFWKELALAGLIEGEYNGWTDGHWYPDTISGGRNASPMSKIQNAYYSILYYESNAFYYTNFDAGHWMWLLQEGSSSNIWAGTTSNTVLSPLEMRGFDIKYDEGVPDDGKIRVPNSNALQGGWGSYFAPNGRKCLVQTATGSNTYDTTISNLACTPLIKMPF